MNTHNIPDTLPDKPSELIELALRDLEAIEKNKNYVVDMSLWHDYPEDEDDKCIVCLAGSVMANSLKVKRKKTLDCESFDPQLTKKFKALNHFRNGKLYEGFQSLGKRLPVKCPSFIDITKYVVDPLLFKVEMFNMVLMLKKFNC